MMIDSFSQLAIRESSVLFISSKLEPAWDCPCRLMIRKKVLMGRSTAETKLAIS